MPTARELLEQADALMRRNRAAMVDDIPVLTDAIAPVPEARVMRVRGTTPPVPSAEADPIPTLTEPVAPEPAPPPVDPVAAEGEPSDWLAMGTAEPSVIGEAPDSVAIVPPVARQAVSEELLASAEHEEIEFTAPPEVEEAFDEELSGRAPPTAWAPAPAEVTARPAEDAEPPAEGRSPPETDGEQLPPAAEQSPSAAIDIETPLTAFDIEAAPAFDTEAPVAGFDSEAPEAGGARPGEGPGPAPFEGFEPFARAGAEVVESPPEVEPGPDLRAAESAELTPWQTPHAVESHAGSAPLVPESYEAVPEGTGERAAGPLEDVNEEARIGSPGEPAAAPDHPPAADKVDSDAAAEEIRMQVLQRLDLFTDTGLREQLGARLQPIVDRASADLVATINQHVGELLRAYVAEALEREIENWRRTH